MHAVRVTCAALALLLSLTASAAAQSASLNARVTDPDRAAGQPFNVIGTVRVRTN